MKGKDWEGRGEGRREGGKWEEKGWEEHENQID